MFKDRIIELGWSLGQVNIFDEKEITHDPPKHVA